VLEDAYVRVPNAYALTEFMATAIKRCGNLHEWLQQQFPFEAKQFTKEKDAGQAKQEENFQELLKKAYRQSDQGRSEQYSV